MALIKLTAAFLNLLCVKAQGFPAGLRDIGQTAHGGLVDDDKAPRLKLAMIGRARGGCQQGQQRIAVWHRGGQRLGGP